MAAELAPEKVAQLRVLFDGGDSPQVAAGISGVSETTTRKYYHRFANPHRVPKRSKGAHLSDDEKSLLRDLYLEGYSALQTANDPWINCSERVVQKYYAILRKGGSIKGPDGRTRQKRSSSDVLFVGPVPKRPCPPPNCMPGLEKLIVRGR